MLKELGGVFANAEAEAGLLKAMQENEKVDIKRVIETARGINGNFAEDFIEPDRVSFDYDPANDSFVLNMDYIPAGGALEYYRILIWSHGRIAVYKILEDGGVERLFMDTKYSAHPKESLKGAADIIKERRGAGEVRNEKSRKDSLEQDAGKGSAEKITSIEDLGKFLTKEEIGALLGNSPYMHCA